MTWPGCESQSWDNEDAIYESSAYHPLEKDWDPAEDGFWELQTSVPGGFWISSGGMLKISEMSVEHLRNAIAWAVRCGFEGSGKLAELRVELEKR